MKTKFILTVLSAATLIGSASAALAESKSQAGGLPELAAEVAALRAMVEELQGSDNPYAGTYTVTTFETAIFACGTTLPQPAYQLPYFARQANSSVSVSSATFEADSNGSALVVPNFNVFTQEVRLSGIYQTDTSHEDGGVIDIDGNGVMEADLGDAVFSGQFADDGSMFTALVVGDGTSGGPNACKDVWTVHVTGVRQ